MNMAEPIPKSGVEERVRLALQVNGSAKEQNKISRMDSTMFAIVRKLVLLKDTGKLNVEECAKVDEAFALFDKHKRKRGIAVVSSILFGHPRIPRSDTKKYPRKIAARIRKRFEGTVFGIREACTNNDELKIPKLTDHERAEIISALDDSVAAIIELRNKIKTEGVTNDEKLQGL